MVKQRFSNRIGFRDSAPPQAAAVDAAVDAAVGQGLQQALASALQQELPRRLEALQFRCAVRNQMLIVLAEHLLHIEPAVEQTLSRLESVIRDLVPEILSAEGLSWSELPVQMFLRIAGYQQPYASRQFRLKLRQVEVLEPVEPPASSVPEAIQATPAVFSFTERFTEFPLAAQVEIAPTAPLADIEVPVEMPVEVQVEVQVEMPVEIQVEAIAEIQPADPSLTIPDPWFTSEFEWVEQPEQEQPEQLSDVSAKVRELQRTIRKPAQTISQGMKLLPASTLECVTEALADVLADEQPQTVEPVLFTEASAMEPTPMEQKDCLHVDLLIHQLTDIAVSETEPDLLIRELSDFCVPENEQLAPSDGALDHIEATSLEQMRPETMNSLDGETLGEITESQTTADNISSLELEHLEIYHGAEIYDNPELNIQLGFEQSDEQKDEQNINFEDIEPESLEPESLEPESLEPESLESESPEPGSLELDGENGFYRAEQPIENFFESNGLGVLPESPTDLDVALPVASADDDSAALPDISDVQPASSETALPATLSATLPAVATELPAPSIAHETRRLSRPTPNWALGAAGVFGLVGGLYMLTRPCVVGRCEQIQQAQQLSLAAIQTARTTDSAMEVVGAYKQLNEANYLLGTIPAWSSHHAEAQALLASYESQSVTLKQVVEALEQANKTTRRSLNPPHPLPVWREIQWSWREVIEGLEKIPSDNLLYGLVQRKLQEYRVNLTSINQRVVREQQAQERVAAARKIGELAQSQTEAAKSTENWQETATNWTAAIRQLQQIPQGTVAHDEAQQLLALYQPKFFQANLQQTQERTAGESYAEALNLAEQARALEQQNQWTEAAAQWRNALTAAQQIPSRSAYYSQVQPLLGTYAKTLQQAQDNAQRSGAVQLAKAGFEQVCAGTPKVCTYTLSPQSIRVQFTPSYDQTVTQMISNASPNNFPPAAIERVNGLLRSLADMSEATQVPIELYNSNGSKLGTYKPNMSGYVLQQ